MHKLTLLFFAACVASPAARDPSMLLEPSPDEEVTQGPVAALNGSRELRPPIPMVLPPARVIDAFDSHTFVDTNDGLFQRQTTSYSAAHATQGDRALKVTAPLSMDPQALDANTVSLHVDLPQSEDWSRHDWLTFDVFMEEAPTSLPVVYLYLRNSKGEEFGESLILGWQLFTGANYQMTFPLKGSDYSHPPIPAHILGDIVSVDLRLARIGDGYYGPALDAVHFHLDQLRLGGYEAWDTFDGPGLGWHAAGDTGTRAGVGHNQTFDASAGALVIAWEYALTAPVARAETSAVALDFSGLQRLTTQVRASGDLAPVRMVLSDGVHTYVSPAQQTSSQWQPMAWALPQTDFDLAHVTQIAFEALDLPLHPRGAVYIDDLRADQAVPPVVRVGKGENYLGWQAPPGTTTTVRASKSAYPESREQGDDVCVVENTASPSACVHGGLASGSKYFYSFFTADTVEHAEGSQDLLLVGNFAFDKVHGGIAYIVDPSTQKLVSFGNTVAWKLLFADQAEPSGIDSTQAELSVGASQLTWKTDQLTVVFDVAGDSIVAHVDNHTGRAISTVRMPNDITFASERVKRVLWPTQEGMMLLREFFTSGRSSHLSRPPMFADAIALESEDGALAIYAVQDSHYQGELIPGHAAADVVTQPNDLYVTGGRVLSHMGFEQKTWIPSGAQWSSVTWRFVTGLSFMQLAEAYRKDNGIDRFPTLREKLAPLGASAFDRLAKHPIYVVEMYKLIEWLRVPLSEAWKHLRLYWRPVLPKGSTLHLTHWQEGRVEDKHPDALPIWWDRYGSKSEYDLFAEDMHADGTLLMPFTNWSVWNKPDRPPLASAPAACLTLRGPAYPFVEYDGYMVKPWHSSVDQANQSMADNYKANYAMDMLFVDMTGERSWRYTLLDDNQTPSVAAYAQSTIEQNRKLAKRFPLFTEGVYDRIGDSITGYSQTLRQKRWNGVLAHLGQEFVDWVPYPFAAAVLHQNVGFYPHNLNSEVWAAKRVDLFSYYALMGYNYYVDTVLHFGQEGPEGHFWIEVTDAMADAVSSRQFGQPLLEFRPLTPDYHHMQSVWGSAANPLTVRAFYDPLETAEPVHLELHDVAPNGFIAETADHDVLAGVFWNRFSGGDLPPGNHWITVVREGNAIKVRHPAGDPTTLRIPLPADWNGVTEAQLSVTLQDGTSHARGRLVAQSGAFMLPVDYKDQTTGNWVRGYTLSR